MNSSRFFVANLPKNTTEEDLKRVFQNYGQIINIELKTKENLVDPNDIKTIAFVTLSIAANNIQYCVNESNGQKLHGKKIKVALAKESFLERLKREREETKTGTNETLQPTEPRFESPSVLLNISRGNKRKTFDIDAELDDDEVAAELLICKKRAASSMHNGKIIIQNQDVKPIHVIESKQKKTKLLDAKSCSADQKRKESIYKMKNQYQQNKVAIQQALQGLNGLLSKKIKFSDGESDEELPNEQTAFPKSRTDIFGSDDGSGDEYDVGFKTGLLGEKGTKLVQMQAKQSLDPRFRIDAKFVDDEEKESVGKDCIDSERQWQMNILEQVVGAKLDTVRDADNSKKNKMLRYDPLKDEHQKFERSKGEEIEIQKTKQKQIKPRVDQSTNDNIDIHNTVSKEVFYVVTDTLQQSLRTRGKGFSLLNMFGKTDQLEERDVQLKQLGNEKVLVNNKCEKSFTINPFSYDSTSESESDVVPTKQEEKGSTNGTFSKHSFNNKKFKIKVESFFIPKNDVRLKEGAKYFIYKKNEDSSIDNYEEVRNRLKLLIKSKIMKSKKSLTNAGYKGKRRV